MTNLAIPLRVMRREAVSTHCQMVAFELPRNFYYAAGQWFDLYAPDTDLAGGTTYSFASSPTEPELLIAFRDGISPLKTRLQTLQPGERMMMSAFGGGFRLNPRRPALLIAGGIGVAPFRSMIREAIDTRVSTSIVLIHASRGGDFAFRAELEAWQKDFPALRLFYVDTKADGRLDAKRLKGLVPDLLDRDSYLCGPGAMVQSTRTTIHELGVPHYQVQTDIFDGY